MERDIVRLIDGLGGMAATHELYASGIRRRQIAVLVSAGRIRRVRQGWFVRADIHPDLARAARVGGRLTCSSALALMGVWVQADAKLHVAVNAHACQLRSTTSPTSRIRPSDARIHWRDHHGRSRLIASPIDALLDLAECVAPDLLRASADSLIRARPAFRHELMRASRNLAVSHREALLRADGICESGTETLFHERSRRIRRTHKMRRQVAIAGVGRVDFLIGDRLVIEVDGFAYHSDPEQFEQDRRRDAALSALGYRVLRFSYHQVMSRWPEVEGAVWAAIARGDSF